MTQGQVHPTRQVVLGVVVFVAALALLVGLWSVLGPDRAAVSPSPTATASPTASPPSSETALASPTGSASIEPSPSAGASPSASGSAPDPPVLVGAGDIATCEGTGDEATAALVERIEGSVFTAGDDAYPNGSAAQFDECYDPSWGRFRDRTYPVPGNHEWETEDLAGYLGYFGERAAPDGTSWYSVDLGAWHVIVLDSECAKVGGCDATSPQGRWLAADLASADTRCTLAIWHKPRWSSGEHGSDADVAPFWDALYAAGADLVVNGHDHDYERFAPQDPDASEDRERGIREFVVGTGGAELRAFRPQPAANSELRVSGFNGVLQLTLHPESYEWRFIPTAGDVSDSGSSRCH